jgi:branched-chain amino acid transport system substrate-binding protein
VTSKTWIRPVAAVLAAAVIITACSGDDESADTTTAGTAVTTPDTTVVDDGLTGDPFPVGLLQPAPGLLFTLFEGQQRGADFAVADIDGGGGVLDGPIEITTTATEAGIAMVDTAVAAIEAGAAALIGPPGSTGGLDVRNEVADLGSTICSASATSPTLTLGQENLSMFRTAVPDDITASYLAGQIINRRDEVAPDAAWKVGIVVRADDYGYAVGNTVAAIVNSAGLVPTVIDYNPRRVEFSGTAEEVAAVAPDVTILVTFAEGGNLLGALIDAGLDPATMIGLDAFFVPRVAELATAGTDVSAADGFRMFGTVGTRAFLQRLYDEDTNGQVSGAAQAYDCAVVLALAQATLDAGDADTLAEAAVAVTRDGITCTSFEDCLTNLQAGDDIDYDGVSGRIALDGNGDPTFALFTTATLDGGSVADVESSDIDVEALRRQFEAFATAALNTKIQQALTFLGFFDGPINGLDSPEFRAAIAAFQESVGLPPTGIWDAATDAAMREALGEYAQLLTETTKDVQRLLTELGFYSGPIDGIWTQEVTDAVKALQRELGVPETGVLDAATLEAVYRRGAESAATTTTTAPPTTAPATTAPATTAPPTTAPPTAPPTTAPPPTVPPTTAPPVDPTLPTLAEALAGDPRLSDYVRLLEAAAFPDDFDRLVQYTLFAPTNDALAAAGIDVEALVESDPEELFTLLTDTVAQGRLDGAKLREPATSPLTMLSGRRAPITVGADGTLTLAGVNYTAIVAPPEIPALNGVIHVLGSLTRA